MEMQVKYDCEGIDFAEVAKVLQIVGMAHHSAEIHRRAFENSAVKVFLLNTNNQLIGFGRAISDNAYQAAMYDIAVVPQYQSEGYGQLIVKEILEKLPNINVMLYAMPRKEKFYQKFGFKKMRTAMARFQNSDTMIAKGFIENE